MSYEQKYLKYKNKYLNLKNNNIQIGGDKPLIRNINNINLFKNIYME